MTTYEWLYFAVGFAAPFLGYGLWRFGIAAHLVIRMRSAEKKRAGPP